MGKTVSHSGFFKAKSECLVDSENFCVNVFCVRGGRADNRTCIIAQITFLGGKKLSVKVGHCFKIENKNI